MSDIQLDFGGVGIDAIVRSIQMINSEANNVKTEFTFNSNIENLLSQMRELKALSTSIGGVTTTSVSSRPMSQYKASLLNSKIQNEARIANNRIINDNKIAEQKIEQQSIKTQQAALKFKNQQASMARSQANYSKNLLTSQQNTIMRMEAWGSKNMTGLQAHPEVLQNYSKELANLKNGVYLNEGSSKMNSVFTQIKYQAQQAGIQTDSLRNRLTGILKNRIGFTLITTAIATAIGAMRGLYQNVDKINSALTQLNIVASPGNNGLKKYFTDASAAAKDTGSDIVDTLESATSYARLGYQKEAVNLAKLTTKYATAGGFESSDATTGITSLLQAYKDVDTTNLEKTLDKMVYVGNHFPISTAELAEGISNAGSALSAAGNSAAESFAILTGANATIQNISKSSTGVRTIAARIRNSETELEDLGETLDASYNTVSKYRSKLKALSGVDILQSDRKTYKSTIQILRELSKVWADISDIDKASITTMIAGTRQQNVFASIMENFDNVENSLKDMNENADGTLDEANQKYLNSIEGKTNQFKATWEELSTTILDSDLIKGTVDMGSGILGFFTQLNKTIGTLPTVAGLSAGLLSLVGNKGVIKTYENPNIASGLGMSIFGIQKKNYLKDNVLPTNEDISIIKNMGVSMAKSHKSITAASIASSKLSDQGKGVAQTLLLESNNADQASIKFTNYANSTKGLGDAFGGLANMGKNLLASLGNMALITATMAIIQFGIDAIDKAIVTDAEHAEIAKNALEEYKQKKEELKSQGDFLKDKDTLNEYQRLAEGVNDLGQNISLSADEYKRYHEICNQIEDLFPNLVKGHDDLGNAILREKGNVEELTKAYKDAQNSAEAKLAKDRKSTFETLSNKLNGVQFTGSASSGTADITLANDEDKSYLAKRNVLKFVGEFLNSKDENQEYLQRFLGNDTYDDIDIDSFKKTKLYQSLKSINPYKGVNFNSNVLEKARKYIVDFLEVEKLYEGGIFNSKTSFKNLQQNAGLIVSAISEYDRKIQDAVSDTRETTIAYLHQNSQAYKDATTEEKAIIDDAVNNLDADFYAGKSTSEIEKGINDIAKLLSRDNIQAQYKLVLDTQTKFNNGEVTYSEWIKQVKALYALIPKKYAGLRRSIQVAFDLNTEGTNTNAYDAAREKLYAMDGKGGNFRRDTEVGKKITEDFLGGLTTKQIKWINDNNILTLYEKYDQENPNPSSEQVSAWLLHVINKGIKDAKKKVEKLSLTDLFGKLDDVKGGLSAIQKGAKSLKDDGTIGFSNLKDIAEQFKGVFDDDKTLDNYIAKLATLKKNSKEYSAIVTELIIQSVKKKVGVQNLTKENKAYVESLLKENGVKNASAVTNRILAEASLENAINTKDSTNKTWDNIQALYEEANGGKLSAKSLSDLNIIKNLVNHTKIDSSDDIQQLLDLGTTAGFTAKQLTELASIKMDLKKYEAELNKENLDPRAGSVLNSWINQLKDRANNIVNNTFDKAKKSFKSNNQLTTIAKIDSGGSKGSKKDKYKTELENLKKRYDADEITLDTYIKKLAKLKKKAKKGSDAYYDIIKELNSAKREKLDNQYNNGQISQEQYINGLKKLLNTMRPTTEAYKKLLEEIRSNQRELWKTQYDNQKISADKYINKLKKQQGYYRKNSKQWLEIENEIYNARKDRLEKYNSKQDYLLKTDQISEKKYYARKLKKAKEFYELDKKGKEEYEQAIEDSYNFLKEQRKKDYEDEKEKLEKKKEAIEEFYDKQKELLEKQKDADDYLSDQTEKRKTVNELRQELARLSNDTSEVAKKRIAEVRKELEDAQKELIDFEKDHAYNATIEFLDEQKENTVKEIDNKIEEIDKSIKNLDEYSKNTYTLLYNWGKKKYPDVVKNLPKDPTKYASGTSSSVGGSVITQERGSEVVGINKKNGFTLLTPESMVWSDEQTKRLWELSKNANLSKNFLPKSVGTNINQNSQINITISDGAVKIEGNADRSTIQNAGKDLAYEILKEFKRYKN